jgi:hypothetical protein
LLRIRAADAALEGAFTGGGWIPAESAPKPLEWMLKMRLHATGDGKNES